MKEGRRMSPKDHHDHILKIMNDPERVRKIIQSAINEALLMHKRMGNPVCEMRDGKIVWIQPEDIIIPEVEPDAKK